MDSQNEFTDADSLALFGKINASISHELKNIMAIISETAGLLGDLAELAESGKPVQPEMLKNCSSSIVEEIQRGFATIRNMNQFAHSVDEPVAEVELFPVLELASHLAGFLSYAGTVTFQPCDEEKPVITTRPFLLQSLLYQTIAKAYKAKGTSLKMVASIHPAANDGGWNVVFEGLALEAGEKIADDEIARLCTSIRAGIIFDGASDRLVLTIPREIT